MFGIDNNSDGSNAPSVGSNYISTPYLNIDPNYLRGSDEYILLEDAAPTRSRVQVMFAVVGTATVTGAVVGGLASVRYTGLQMLKKSTRMQATSAILKNGGRIASKFGSVAFLYCACSVISEKLRGVEDELNTIIGSASAGALYSLPSVLNVKKYSPQVAEEIDKLGFLRRHFVRLPPFGRFVACTGAGLLAGGLLSFYKTQASDYIKEITSKT